MMNYAHIQDNIVVNIVVADEAWVDAQGGNFVSIENQNVQIGSSYENGVFIQPQPYTSWTRVGDSWQAPTPMPLDGGNYYWDEESLSWLEIPNIGVNDEQD